MDGFEILRMRGGGGGGHGFIGLDGGGLQVFLRRVCGVTVWGEAHEVG